MSHVRRSRRELLARALPARLVLTLLAACTSSLPRPPSGPVSSGGMIEVPYPPPPARVETIPPKNAAREVWVNGQWEWNGKGWSWHAGGWTTPPPNAYFTAWSTKRRADGQLLFGRAEWRDRTGRPLRVETQSPSCPPQAPSPPTAETTKP